jgi:hypothetical protein
VAERKPQIAFYGSEDYRRWLHEEAWKRKIKVQKLLEDAVAAYVSGPKRQEIGPKPEYCGERGRFHRYLDIICASGKQQLIGTAENVLRLLAYICLLNKSSDEEHVRLSLDTDIDGLQRMQGEEPEPEQTSVPSKSTKSA